VLTILLLPPGVHEHPVRVAQVLSFLPLSLSLSRKIRTACGLFFGRYGLPLPHATQIVSVVGAPIPGARRARPCAARQRDPGCLRGRLPGSILSSRGRCKAPARMTSACAARAERRPHAGPPGPARWDALACETGARVRS